MTTAVQPELSVVVPVYGRFDLLERCLHSLRNHTSVPHEIIVVDDASQGGPPTLGQDVILTRRPLNGGFAAAVNSGIAEARGDVVAVVNSDAEVTSGWDLALLAAVDANSALVAALQVDAEGRVVEGGTVVGGDGHVALIDETSGINTRDSVSSVPVLSAACIAARRVDLLRWGGFSRRYGRGYYEDVDLSLLVRHLGHRCVVANGARVVHTGNGTFRTDEVMTRLVAGRAVLKSRWHWALRDRPSVHRWETLPHRGAFARSFGSSGRALVVGDHSWTASLLTGLFELDIGHEVAESAALLDGQIDHLDHWADVVIGDAIEMQRCEEVLLERQPRAVRLEFTGSVSEVLFELLDQGLGRDTAGHHAPQCRMNRRA